MRIAVVLFNLGGPDRLTAVRPFLHNLFSDPAIIAAPRPTRWALAVLLSRLRIRKAKETYRKIGGRSPILPNTQAQAAALGKTLQSRGDDSFHVFIGMRYWKPFISDAARGVYDLGPDKIILLPLYPQFSTTTTGSSLVEWKRQAARVGVDAPTTVVGCYPTASGFVSAMARLTAKHIDQTGDPKSVRVLFSAHGLPTKIVKRGDPYQWQVEQTAAAIAAQLTASGHRWADLDWRVCYQSRVGPLQWIGPATTDEIERAGADKKSIVVAPIAFVSEHSETLVELDIKYRALADASGVPSYVRVPTVDTEREFIDGLADLVCGLKNAGPGPASHTGGRLCPATFGR
ncbi:MAG: ferrochelatase [Alphaproteobacteria bacterium]|nr:ferrochelatase [Alphaproteobacteria bacterium]